MTKQYYYPVDDKTGEILDAVEAHKMGGLYHIPRNALQKKPLDVKKGFAVVAVFDDDGCAVDSKYAEDNRGTVIYDKSDCNKSEVVTDLGSIKDGFTDKKPKTQFDEFIKGKWVTNQANKYIADYAQVDAKRAYLYAQLTDPLENELQRAKRDGLTEKVSMLDERIRELEHKIKSENPFPDLPR